MKHSFNKIIAEKYGIEEAILYENISYWCEKNQANGKNIHDCKAWTYNTYSAFEELFPYITASKIKTSLRHLKEVGLIEVRNDLNDDKWNKTNWYAVVKIQNYGKGDVDLVDKVKTTPSISTESPHVIKDTVINTDIKPIIKHTETEKDFDSFYKEYPKKVGKGQALKTWKSLGKKKELPDIDIIISYLKKKKETDWKDTEKRFIPNPSTWLNSIGWEDEIITDSHKKEYVSSITQEDIDSMKRTMGIL